MLVVNNITKLGLTVFHVFGLSGAVNDKYLWVANFFGVGENPDLGVPTPRPPVGGGSVPPPNPPSKHRLFETVGSARNRSICWCVGWRDAYLRLSRAQQAAPPTQLTCRVPLVGTLRSPLSLVFTYWRVILPSQRKTIESSSAILCESSVYLCVKYTPSTQQKILNLLAGKE